MRTPRTSGDGRAAHITRRGLLRGAAGVALWPMSRVDRAAAQSEAVPIVATAATLTVLGGRVEHGTGAGPASPARSGANLAEGDRVVTGPDGRALITFLDGSTVTVEPGSQVVVRQAAVGSADRSSIRILIAAGTVWARLARWLGGRATLTLESNAYAATAHDGLIGAQSRPDGGFVCWTRAGTLELAEQGAGRAAAVLAPGQKATVASGGAPVTEPFAVHQSALEVTVTGAVAPLVLMPDRTRVAGFVAPGIEVNQVFGSLTATREGARLIEVPAGAPGPYLVVLDGLDGGPFTLAVTGRFQGQPAYRHEASGHIQRGERLAAEITQRLAADAGDPRTARVVDGSLGPLRGLAGPRPGTVLLSPHELAAARAR
ncbi:MAG: hypothetical protein L0027_05695 [Candidatus Rokubacteria bacterium]|nr:hypothetical protein [Candidatus Rokubacteria bacterium]